VVAAAVVGALGADVHLKCYLFPACKRDGSAVGGNTQLVLQWPQHLRRSLDGDNAELMSGSGDSDDSDVVGREAMTGPAAAVSPAPASVSTVLRRRVDADADCRQLFHCADKCTVVCWYLEPFSGRVMRGGARPTLQHIHRTVLVPADRRNTGAGVCVVAVPLPLGDRRGGAAGVLVVDRVVPFARGDPDPAAHDSLLPMEMAFLSQVGARLGLFLQQQRQSRLDMHLVAMQQRSLDRDRLLVRRRRASVQCDVVT
jgi:hypothetical protein